MIGFFSMAKPKCKLHLRFQETMVQPAAPGVAHYKLLILVTELASEAAFKAWAVATWK